MPGAAAAAQRAVMHSVATPRLSPPLIQGCPFCALACMCTKHKLKWLGCMCTPDMWSDLVTAHGALPALGDAALRPCGAVAPLLAVRCSSQGVCVAPFGPTHGAAPHSDFSHDSTAATPHGAMQWRRGCIRVSMASAQPCTTRQPCINAHKTMCTQAGPGRKWLALTVPWRRPWACLLDLKASQLQGRSQQSLHDKKSQGANGWGLGACVFRVTEVQGQKQQSC